MPPRSYASQGGRISIRSSNRDQENLPVMRFSSIIYGRQRPKRWDTTEVKTLLTGPASLEIRRYQASAFCVSFSTNKGSRGTIDDASCRRSDHGADLGAGSWGGAAFCFAQESHQLLRAVRSREELRQHDAPDASVQAAQQAFADDVDRGGQDGAAKPLFAELALKIRHEHRLRARFEPPRFPERRIPLLLRLFLSRHCGERVSPRLVPQY